MLAYLDGHLRSHRLCVVCLNAPENAAYSTAVTIKTAKGIKYNP